MNAPSQLHASRSLTATSRPEKAVTSHRTPPSPSFDCGSPSSATVGRSPRLPLTVAPRPFTGCCCDPDKEQDKSPLSRRRLVAVELPCGFGHAGALALARAVNAPSHLHASRSLTATSRLAKAVTSHRTPPSRSFDYGSPSSATVGQSPRLPLTVTPRPFTGCCCDPDKEQDKSPHAKSASGRRHPQAPLPRATPTMAGPSCFRASVRSRGPRVNGRFQPPDRSTNCPASVAMAARRARRWSHGSGRPGSP